MWQQVLDVETGVECGNRRCLWHQKVFDVTPGFCLGFFLSNHRGSHISSSWMVHAGYVFVAGIHPSKT